VSASAPCTWPISYASCADCTALTSMSAPDRALVEAMATGYLWNWTLKAFGVCPLLVRPCRQDCSSFSTFFGAGPFPRGFIGGGLWPNPQLVGGQWTNVSCGFCPQDNCSCGSSRLMTLRLPGPISEVSSILVDGAVLSPSAYRVDNHSLLVRLDGTPWPRCQDMTLPTSSVGTFSVAYQRGRDVPIGGQVAAGLLACELAKAICRDSACALPQRVQTITRQGVTMAMIDNGQGIAQGETGIWAIDSWVSSITQPARPSTVLSPDIPRPKWRTS
jgi:hypothetical protein